jgi:putative drug exporter of the RND superfamily
MVRHRRTVNLTPEAKAMQTYPNSLLPTTATAPRFPTEPVEGDDTMAPPLLSRLARFCFEHRWRVVAVWLLALVSLLAISSATGTKFNSDFTLPGTDSQAAVTLLTKNFPAVSGEEDQVVIQATHGATVRSGPVRLAVDQALAHVAELPGVAAVGSPYGAPASQISRDGTVAFATVTWQKQSSQVTNSDANRLVKAAKAADGPDVHISLGGILTHLFSIPTVATDLSILIGLGVGVDYGLFIISRHRSAVKAGMSYEDAAAQAVNTSGRTVLFAGITVCIALLGQLTLGVNFLYGLSVSAAIAVALTMAASLTFAPAMFGFLGPKVLSRRERVALQANGPTSSDATGFWLRWAKAVEARPALVGLCALAVVAGIALPLFALRLGLSDASTDPSTSTTHQAYTALARGFGPGFNGPFELVGQLRSPTDLAAFQQLLRTAAQNPGVATVTPAVTSPNAKVALATLYPTTSPQATQTENLINRLRHVAVPTAENGTGLVVHIGGSTAADIDFAHVLTDKLPLFIAVVVLLAFLLLMAVFRSLLIPLVALLMNLLSVGAALGALNAVFNWGFGKSVLGLSATGPVDAFIPVLMFSVLFGLSMDYEIYLVSRIQEEWHYSRGIDTVPALTDGRITRNHGAITTGQAKSGRVIAAAATIMILVFGSFLLDGQRVLQEFGFGLGFSVLVDALVIRSLLLPAVMHLIGPANWAMPRWLGKVVPRPSIETEDEALTGGYQASQDEPATISDLRPLVPVGEREIGGSQ